MMDDDGNDDINNDNGNDGNLEYAGCMLRMWNKDMWMRLTEVDF